MALHDRLKQIRLERNMSQMDFARLANVSQPTIANWENGSHIPRPDKLESLAEELSFDLLWLLSGDGDATRRMATPYLLRAIHHIPVYDWPENSQTIEGVNPVGYIPFAARQQPRFALRRPQDKSGRDRLWIIDSHENSDGSQPQLIQRNGSYQIVTNKEEAKNDPIIGPVLASIYLYARKDLGFGAKTDPYAP